MAADMRSRGMQQRTIAAYGRIARQFIAEHPNIEDYTRLTISEWIYAADTKSKQRHRYLAINALCRALVEEEMLANNPCARIKMPIEPVTPQAILSDTDFDRLIGSCDRTFIGRRDRAILYFLDSTGCRVAELTAMDIDDLNLDARQALLRNTKREPNGQQTPRVVFLHENAIKSVASWLHARRHIATENALWVDAKGRRLAQYTIQQMIRRRGERLGIRVSAHQFRRRLAANWLLEGQSEAGLMEMGGWKSSVMPSRYAKKRLTEIAREDHRRLNEGRKKKPYQS